MITFISWLGELRFKTASACYGSLLPLAINNIPVCFDMVSQDLLSSFRYSPDTSDETHEKQAHAGLCYRMRG